MGLLSKLLGVGLPPASPDRDEEEDVEVVKARNADVRSVIDETLDEWQRDLARIGMKPGPRVGPAEALRHARHRPRQ